MDYFSPSTKIGPIGTIRGKLNTDSAANGLYSPTANIAADHDTLIYHRTVMRSVHMRGQGLTLPALSLVLLACGSSDLGSTAVINPGSGIVVTPTVAGVSVGQTLKFSAGPTTVIGASTVTWSASDTSIATVDQTGLVTARKAGLTSVIASISATVSGATPLTVIP